MALTKIVLKVRVKWSYKELKQEIKFNWCRLRVLKGAFKLHQQ